ncbi:hypothetical protein [Lactiplantibacillus pingfangensis]|uniref:hypothetical protein n=1 Tax=Lactiplantibacillus pingfangensis TaxID=2559915 RepID=UPI0014858D14|nr:hypothetical protein [Lactiplantibacillus pingfangensis]
MLVGHARKDITPTAPFYLLGYKTPLRNQPAKGVHGAAPCQVDNQIIKIVKQFS